ncbi:hypothetical protein F9C07_1934447 [Aspergillus flavus]|uniref:Uncharacterized protein n=1 Tax=Aspergillus flavus (strain ATCC 200026 / FGSC A1120 / IAM 13836 / NRRL 3357 / JCM 12722 / SRRC 167) TaxID=332952 RepID=A0A7U2R292_ASPFN|nr:uncharacterized protein G4B84_011837 [Aspergillus flavus NRRL3357]KAF7626695.1 hypothetical protein AFLA_014084 [Aspergillus flavus NRRL3357]QMW36308.1 hypothetical protein G4B84_011837 [Aspergillus flavus NRRL3357]QRD92697.1 hypothetical protein F9C07_1934447 [Aspergillus flavus]
MASPSFIYPSLMLNPVSLVDPFPSQWRITAKVNEYAYEMEENELEYGFRVPCFRAKFHCEEVGNPGHQAYMVLYMQIPFTGTEYISPDMRTQQASSDLPDVALEEFKCYQTLKDIHCEHTPTLIGSSKEAQGPDGWVPGGYLFYFAFTKVPGVRLKSGVIGKGLFYTLPLPQRDQIREAFKVAYTSFSRTGVRPQWVAQDSLFWDDTTGKVYIAGPFQLTTSPGEWEPRLWKHWFLDEGRITGGKTMNQ